jgi:hypothetical protein
MGNLNLFTQLEFILDRKEVQWSRHYGTSQKVAGLSHNETNDFYQFTQSFPPH